MASDTAIGDSNALERLPPIICVTALTYFTGVALATLLGISAAMFLRPAFARNMQDLIGLESPKVARPDSFYAVRVAPLLETHCTSCHGAKRQKAQLRLDTFSYVMRGGKNGDIIKPGHARDSELFLRLILPSTDDKAMPPLGKPPLTANDVTVIKLWIEAGASSEHPVGVIKGAPPPVKKITFRETDATKVQEQRMPLAAEMSSLQARFPGAIAYVARDSADIEVNASLLGRSFGDDELSALAPLQERIVTLDLSRTAITDTSAALIAGMPQLRSLRLTDTDITDAFIRRVESLKSLRYLTVAGTGVLAESTRTLRARGIQVYDGRF